MKTSFNKPFSKWEKIPSQLPKKSSIENPFSIRYIFIKTDGTQFKAKISREYVITKIEEIYITLHFLVASSWTVYMGVSVVYFKKGSVWLCHSHKVCHSP